MAVTQDSLSNALKYRYASGTTSTGATSYKTVTVLGSNFLKAASFDDTALGSLIAVVGLIVPVLEVVPDRITLVNETELSSD